MTWYTVVRLQVNVLAQRPILHLSNEYWNPLSLLRENITHGVHFHRISGDRRHHRWLELASASSASEGTLPEHEQYQGHHTYIPRSREYNIDIPLSDMLRFLGPQDLKLIHSCAIKATPSAQKGFVGPLRHHGRE